MLLRTLISDVWLPEQLGWTVLHFFWQAALLALVLAAARLALPNAAASQRYLFACVTLLLMAAAPVLTFCFYSESYDARGPLMLTVVSRQLGLTLLSRLRPHLSWIVDGWLVGVGLLLIFRLGGLLFLRWALRTDKEPINNPHFNELARRVGVRRQVRFIKSLALQAPATLGTLRPVVLVPAGALTGLNPQYLDALVMHELAHIRRQDFLVNILQTMLETLFFFHPAVWWVSNVVRAERENCCDDLAAGVCASQKVYAEALVAMEDLRDSLPAYALGARGGQFLLRINRLLAPRLAAYGRASGTAVLGALCSMIGVILLLNQALIGAAADRVRGPGDLHSLSATVAEVLGSYRSSSPNSFPELRDAVQAFQLNAADADHVIAKLVDALNKDARPDFLTKQIVQMIAVGEPDHHDRPTGAYGTCRERQQLMWHVYARGRSVRRSDPDRAARYARAALILASQEELYLGTEAVNRLLGNSLFMSLAQVTPKQAQRVRRALAEHDRVTSLARRREQEALEKLAAASVGVTASPRQELDGLMVLAGRRRDIQWRVATIYQQWLLRADEQAKQAALSAARSWRQMLDDAVFTTWLDQAERLSLARANTTLSRSGGQRRIAPAR